MVPALLEFLYGGEEWWQGVAAPAGRAGPSGTADLHQCHAQGTRPLVTYVACLLDSKSVACLTAFRIWALMSSHFSTLQHWRCNKVGRCFFCALAVAAQSAAELLNPERRRQLLRQALGQHGIGDPAAQQVCMPRWLQYHTA